MRKLLLFVIVSFALILNVSAAMKSGTPDIRSLGSLAFGPDGVLLIGDSVSGILFAVDLNDRTPNGEAAGLEVTDIDEKLAAMLGTTAKRVRIHDLAVNPISQNTYLTVSRGRGENAVNFLIRVTPSWSLLNGSTFGEDPKSAPDSLSARTIRMVQDRSDPHFGSIEFGLDAETVEGLRIRGLSQPDFGNVFPVWAARIPRSHAFLGPMG